MKIGTMMGYAVLTRTLILNLEPNVGSQESDAAGHPYAPVLRESIDMIDRRTISRSLLRASHNLRS